MKKAKGIQIYLKPGIEEDDILLNLWEICKLRNRPQEMFRNLLQRGLVDMIKNNEIPVSILDELNYESINIQRKKSLNSKPNITHEETQNNNNIETVSRNTSTVPDRYFSQKTIESSETNNKPKAKNISEGLM